MRSKEEFERSKKRKTIHRECCVRARAPARVQSISCGIENKKNHSTTKWLQSSSAETKYNKIILKIEYRVFIAINFCFRDASHSLANQIDVISDEFVAIACVYRRVSIVREHRAIQKNDSNVFTRSDARFQWIRNSQRSNLVANDIRLHVCDQLRKMR